MSNMDKENQALEKAKMVYETGEIIRTDILAGLTIRRSLEVKARELFILKGGKPIRNYPHYMTVGECPWLLDWFEKGKELHIPIEEFDPYSISFSYGDLFPTMRYWDGKKYRGQIYTIWFTPGVEFLRE